MVDTGQHVRERVSNAIWVELGRDPETTDETVWPFEKWMRLPAPLYDEDEGIGLDEAALDSVDLIAAEYLTGRQQGSAFRAVTAFDLGDGFYHVIQIGGEEPILRVVTPVASPREAFVQVERAWIEENIAPQGFAFPSRLESIDREEPWFHRALTDALMNRGPEGYQQIWDLVTADRRLEVTDPDAVLASWRRCVEVASPNDASHRTGMIPGLTEKEIASDEFDTWLGGVDLQWSDTDEPILYETARALRLVCFYLAAPASFSQEFQRRE